jgi:hypothetical protein
VLIIVVLIAEPGGLAALFRRARSGVTALLGRTGGDR